MGRPCKCCESEDCSLYDLVNFKLLTDPDAIQRNKENIELRKSQGRFVDPFEEFTNSDPVYSDQYPPIPLGANELQWDVFRGSAELSKLYPPTTDDPFGINYRRLILSYTGEDFVALHKTPMSVSREINRMRLGLNFDVNYHKSTFGGVEVGTKHILGDLLFFAKENATLDFAEGWSLRIESTVATQVDYLSLQYPYNQQYDEKFVHGYDIDFTLFDENGNGVLSERIFYIDRPSLSVSDISGTGGSFDRYGDWETYSNQEAVTAPFDVFAESICGGFDFLSFVQFGNYLAVDNNISAIHIETRCGSDTVEFWLNQNGEFLLFSYDIPQHRRPGNRWGVRQADSGSERGDNADDPVGDDIKGGVFYPSTQGVVAGAGEAAAVDGDMALSINTIGYWNRPSMRHCDSCYKTLFFEDGIPQAIMKIVIEDYPTEAYSFFSGRNNYQFLDWDSGIYTYENSITWENFGVSFNALGHRRSITDFTPGGNVNGTYYVGPDFVGCPDGDSEQGFCGLPNILLKLAGGSFTTYRMGGQQPCYLESDGWEGHFLRCPPIEYNINDKEAVLFDGSYNILFKTHDDFYTSSNIKLEEKTIDYQNAYYNQQWQQDGTTSRTIVTEDKTIKFSRFVFPINDDTGKIIRRKGTPANLFVEDTTLPDKDGNTTPQWLGGYRGMDFKKEIIDDKLTFFKDSSLDDGGEMEKSSPLDIAKITVTMVNDYGD